VKTTIDVPEDILRVSLLLKRRSLSGSLIGGISETQEMLDFCGKHNGSVCSMQ
jgi:alcohol dehydrogenase (NADP+)